MIKIPPLDQPLYKINKKFNESIKYQFDFSDILDKNEVITTVTCTLDSRPRKGKLIEIVVPETTIPGASSFQETIVKVQYETNFSNKRSFSFIVRTYR